MTKNLFRFGLILVLASVQAQQPADIAECFDCCLILFDDGGALEGENSLENTQRVDACRDGCSAPDVEVSPCGVDNGNLDEACGVGFDFLTEGTTDFFIDTDLIPTSFFCVNGQIDISFGPTPAPTPPTQAPVAATETPTITDNDDESQLPLIIGIGAGGSVFLLILLVLLYPSKEKRRRRFKKGLVEEDGSEDDNKVNPTIARGAVSPRRPQLPNFNNEGQSAMGQSVAESIANLRESDLANSGTVQATFEVMKNFQSEHKDELTAVRGEILMGLSAVDEAWWIVKREKTGEVGMVPLAFLKELFSVDVDSPEPEPPANAADDIF